MVDHIPPEGVSKSRQAPHKQNIRMWQKVDPTSFRMASVINPATGQEHGALFCLAEEGGQTHVWTNTRNGWEIAPGWMGASFQDKLAEDRAAAATQPTAIQGDEPL